MSDLVIRDISDDLRRRLEECARAHGRSLDQEIEVALSSVAAKPRPAECGLGTWLSGLVPPDLWDDDFIQPRELGPRPPPDFR